MSKSSQQQQRMQADHVIRLFNKCFLESEHTVLVRGEGEPIYQPASNRSQYHQVVFAHGFVRSALHEIAHWTLAGRVRRQLLDYGYWYAPDGRTAEQQARFEQVEVSPQAIEWLLSLAAGVSFEVSVDNLAGGEVTDRVKFTRAIVARATERMRDGLPPRAERFMQALCAERGFDMLTQDDVTRAGHELIANEVARAALKDEVAASLMESAKSA
ncbi:elongation factor P hydroxylase [Aliidiomarina indica]|uniref:elongation factor P hydroxylase n=1 Tax=Aliidiomarina indica TaxID=2749147 RepID=UPI00188E23CF|nr:elongation factor P hydroxylase [Aliidiomarina indica]